MYFVLLFLIASAVSHHLADFLTVYLLVELSKYLMFHYRLFYYFSF